MAHLFAFLCICPEHNMRIDVNSDSSRELIFLRLTYVSWFVSDRIKNKDNHVLSDFELECYVLGIRRLSYSLILSFEAVLRNSTFNQNTCTRNAFQHYLFIDVMILYKNVHVTTTHSIFIKKQEFTLKAEVAEMIFCYTQMWQQKELHAHRKGSAALNF